jgi:hypothetical protein
MKILLTETQFERIFDIDEEDRKRIGMGLDHKVYSTKFSNDYLIKMGIESGDIVTKTGSAESIFKFAKQFEKYPDIFPIVYRVGRKYMKDNSGAYMKIEAVNTEKFVDLINKLKNAIRFHFPYEETLNTEPKILETIFYTRDYDDGEREDEIRGNRMIIFEELKKQSNQELYNFFVEFLRLTKKLETLMIQGEITSDLGILDLHEGNFGFTKNGKIKCIDY